MSFYKPKDFKEASFHIINGKFIQICYNDVLSSNFLSSESSFLNINLRLLPKREMILEIPENDPSVILKPKIDEALLWIQESCRSTIEQTNKAKQIASKKILKKRIFAKTRLKVTKMLKENYNSSYIQLKAGINKKSFEAFKRKYNSNMPILINKRGRKSKATPDELEILESFIKNNKNKFASSKEMLNKWSSLCNWPNNHLSISTFRRILKNDLNMSYKKVYGYHKAKNNSKTMSINHDFCCKLVKQVFDNRKVIFLDETGFNLESHKNFGWSKIGTPMNFEKKIKSCNYSVIGATSNQEFIGITIIKGSVNSEIFCGFIINLINHLYSSKKCVSNSDFILIMDNARCHKRHLVKVIEPHFNILWTPPYTPELNPIELVWAEIKRNVYNKGCYSNEDELLFAIASSIQHITPTKSKSYFDHCLNFCEKSLRNELFAASEELERR
mgnify:CR=1 FL=1